MKLFTVTVSEYGTFSCSERETFLELFQREHIPFRAPCGGKGRCGKCAVLVNGKKELACKTSPSEDCTVTIPTENGGVHSEQGVYESGRCDGENVCFAVDIGTTTVTVALTDEKSAVKTLTFDNPQIVFGADVVSRIQFCTEYGVERLRRPLLAAIKRAMEELLPSGARAEKIFVCGNTTMLHIFWGEDCSGLGKYPYTPVFLDSRTERAEFFGWKEGEVTVLPGVSSYVGSDTVAALCACNLRAGEKVLLVDLGTNAEIALSDGEKIYVSATSAGPCFEGGNISCGMSATEGAITHFSLPDKKISFIGLRPTGLCGTGLIDVVAQLCLFGSIDKTGRLEKEYVVAPGVVLTQRDVREFQLAKAAIFSGIQTLSEVSGVEAENIDRICLAGGFSAHIVPKNAVLAGLLPKESENKCITIGNGALRGTIDCLLKKKDAQAIVNRCRYVDLNGREDFQKRFLSNLNF